MNLLKWVIFIVLLLIAGKFNYDLWKNPEKTERQVLMEYFK